MVLARSNFDPGHRITLTATYDIPLVKAIRPVVSVFYAGSSGRPYTLTYGRDVNGDAVGGAGGAPFNDLLYIPTATDTFTYTGGTLQRPARVPERRPVPRGLHRADHSAQRLPRALDEHARRPLRRPAAVQALQDRAHG